MQPNNGIITVAIALLLFGSISCKELELTSRPM